MSRSSRCDYTLELWNSERTAPANRGRYAVNPCRIHGKVDVPTSGCGGQEPVLRHGRWTERLCRSSRAVPARRWAGESLRDGLRQPTAVGT